MRFLSRIILFTTLLAPTPGHGAKLDWKSAENVPFKITNGVEVARHAARKRPARLSLVYSVEGSLHLLLRTWLPIPEAYRTNLLRTDNDVPIFVDRGIERQLPIAVDVVATGRNHVENREEWLNGIDEPDTIITPPLSAAQVATLEAWSRSVPPMAVSVVGIWETGVFMVGTRVGGAIRTVRERCETRPG